MKKIVWLLGVVLVSGAALLTLESNAAVGDIVYIKPTAEVQVTGASLTSLGNFVANLFPDSEVSKIRQVHCTRKNADVFCGALYEVTVGAVEMADLVLSGKLTRDNVQNFDGANGTFYKREPQVLLTAGQKTSVSNFATNVVGIVDVGALSILWCNRRDGGVFCYGAEVVTGTPAEWAQDLTDGNVAQTVGKVE